MNRPEMTVNALIEPFRASRPHCGTCSRHAVDHPVHDYFAHSQFDDVNVSLCDGIRTRAIGDSLYISNFLLKDFYKLN